MCTLHGTCDWNCNTANCKVGCLLYLIWVKSYIGSSRTISFKREDDLFLICYKNSLSSKRQDYTLHNTTSSPTGSTKEELLLGSILSLSPSLIPRHPRWPDTQKLIAGRWIARTCGVEEARALDQKFSSVEDFELLSTFLFRFYIFKLADIILSILIKPRVNRGVAGSRLHQMFEKFVSAMLWVTLPRCYYVETVRVGRQTWDLKHCLSR